MNKARTLIRPWAEPVRDIATERAHQTVPVTGSPVRAEVVGRLARIILDRPGAINSLTIQMVDHLHDLLSRFETGRSVRTIVISGEGSRGLCAGGDLVPMRASALGDKSGAREFLRREYRLIARIATFPKPIVALMHGYVMGGGVGLACHAAHRLATETLTWAMPEVTIGFTPDVGATYLLSRAPDEFGTHVALTAARLGVDDALALGLADDHLPQDRVDDLLDLLTTGDVAKAIAAVTVGRRTDTSPPDGAPTIAGCYRGDDLTVILRRLQDAGEIGERALSAIAQSSPTSVLATFAALRMAARLPSLEACLAQEYRLACAMIELPDFVEGVRAALIDKDGAPRWDPPSLEEVDPASVSALLGGPADLVPLWQDADLRR